MQDQTDGMFVSTETHTYQHTMEHTNRLNSADAGSIRHQLFILEKTTEDLGSRRQKKAVPPKSMHEVKNTGD